MPRAIKPAIYTMQEIVLIREIDGLGEITNYIYDAADNLVSVIDKNGNKTEYEYDELNRQIKQINALGDEYLSSYDKSQ